MFKIGDYVQNKKNGYVGKVIGYGHQVANGVYTTTLKVLIDKDENFFKRGVVAEELYSDWNMWPTA